MKKEYIIAEHKTLTIKTGAEKWKLDYNLICI